MSVRITCPNPECGRAGRIPDDFPGGKVRCPACGVISNVPAASASKPAASASKPAAPPRAMRPAPPPIPDTNRFDDLDDVEDAAEPIAAPRRSAGGRRAAPAEEPDSGGPNGLVLSLAGGLAAVVLVIGGLWLRSGGGAAERKRADRERETASADSEPPAVVPTATAPTTSPGLALAPTSVAAPATTDPQEVVRRLKEATVYIKNSVNGKLISTGTGFVIERIGPQLLIATNRHVVVPDLDDLPEDVVPKDAKLGLEAVFRSGQGPRVEQAVPAHIVAADMSMETNKDLAFLVVEGITNPPVPLDAATKSETTEGMSYIGAGFPLGGMMGGITGNRGNPSVTITRGGVASLMRDEHGQLSIVKVDGSLLPGNSGGPLVEEKTGRLIGVAVAKASMADTVGFLVPADELRRTLAGRVGALDLTLNAAAANSADLIVKAQVVDPKRQVRGVVVHIAPAASVGTPTPNPDGTWPPLPGAMPVELDREAKKSEAVGRVQVKLDGQGKDARKVFVQTAHRDASGKLVYAAPKAIDLPDKPGRISGGGLEKIFKALRRKSLAMLKDLVDPDSDCTMTKDKSDFKVTINIPPKIHTLSPEIPGRPGASTAPAPKGSSGATKGARPRSSLHNAPMTLADVKGDFAAIVRVTGDMNPGSTQIKDPRGRTLPFTFQGAGLVLYEDRNNFLRLERSTGTTGGVTLVHRLLIEVVRDGKQAMPPIYLDVNEGDLDLILVRRKGRLRCMFSMDRRSIIAFKEFALDFPDKVKVGLTAANISKQPLAAQFEEFVLISDATKIDQEFGQ